MEIAHLCLKVLIISVSLASASSVSGPPSFVCGENIDVLPKKKVEVTTPIFPNLYPENAKLYVDTVYREPKSRAYIGPNKIGTFCGDNFCDPYEPEFNPLDKEFESTGRCMTVNFYSDDSVPHSGFLAKKIRD